MKTDTQSLCDWLPIATAPKDGDEVFVGVDIATVWIARNARWVDAAPPGSCVLGSDPEDVGWWAYANSVSQEKLEGIHEPTHWLPMPEPPSEFDTLDAEMQTLAARQTVDALFSATDDDLLAQREYPASIMRTLIEPHRTDAENPDWENSDRVRNWRNYVTDEVKTIWSTLPLPARCSVVDCCEKMASNEEGD